MTALALSTRDKIIKYLGQGIQQSIVASSCGVTPAYISQMLELEDVRSAIAAEQAGQLEVALESDANIERIEKKALAMVETRLPMVTSAMEAAKIFATLNASKKKVTAGARTEDAISAQQVVITVPRGASIHFKVSEQNQVIEVDGRSMAPLPSSGLAALSKAQAGVQAITDLPAKPEQVQSANSSSPEKAKHQAADLVRATGILRDLSVVMNGARVVL